MVRCDVRGRVEGWRDRRDQGEIRGDRRAKALFAGDGNGAGSATIRGRVFGAAKGGRSTWNEMAQGPSAGVRSGPRQQEEVCSWGTVLTRRLA